MTKPIPFTFHGAHCLADDDCIYRAGPPKKDIYKKQSALEFLRKHCMLIAVFVTGIPGIPCMNIHVVLCHSCNTHVFITAWSLKQCA